MDITLKKYFVSVNDSSKTVDDIKELSLELGNDKKIYFIKDKKSIVVNGVVYGGIDEAKLQEINEHLTETGALVEAWESALKDGSIVTGNAATYYTESDEIPDGKEVGDIKTEATGVYDYIDDTIDEAINNIPVKDYSVSTDSQAIINGDTKYVLTVDPNDSSKFMISTQLKYAKSTGSITLSDNTVSQTGGGTQIYDTSYNISASITAANKINSYSITSNGNKVLLTGIAAKVGSNTYSYVYGGEATITDGVVTAINGLDSFEYTTNNISVNSAITLTDDLAIQNVSASKSGENQTTKQTASVSVDKQYAVLYWHEIPDASRFDIEANVANNLKSVSTTTTKTSATSSVDFIGAIKLGFGTDKDNITWVSDIKQTDYKLSSKTVDMTSAGYIYYACPATMTPQTLFISTNTTKPSLGQGIAGKSVKTTDFYSNNTNYAIYESAESQAEGTKYIWVE